MPGFGLFRRNWRNFRLFRFGLLMIKVPLPMYSAWYSFSFCLVSVAKGKPPSKVKL